MTAQTMTYDELLACFTRQGERVVEQKTRIVDLERALRKILDTAAPTSHHANYCVVHRQLLGEARELMGR